MKTHSFIIITILMLICGQSALTAQCLLWDTEHLAALKADPESPLHTRIENGAKWFASQPPMVVTRKGQSFSGDYHNYESLSFYSWPDPANPGGPWTLRQGFINPQYKEYDFERLNMTSTAMRLISFAYYLTGKQEYYDAAMKYIRGWFVDPLTYMYPQMEYAQVRPGENGNHGTCWGIIEAYSFLDLLESYLLINSIQKIDKETDAKVHEWVKQFASWLINSENGKKESQTDNMHSVAYDVMLYYFASFNKDKKLMKQITNGFVEKRLKKQIADDGHMPFEMEGGRVFHDHLYNLQHIDDFCIMQKRQGKNFYAQNQQIIDKVFDFLLPYMKAPETFPYTQVSDWDTDITDFKIELMRMSRMNTKYARNRVGYEVDMYETEFSVVK